MALHPLPARALTVDDFTQGPLTLAANQGPGTYTIHQGGLDPSHVLRGGRFSRIELLSEVSVGPSITVDTTSPGTFRFVTPDATGYFDLVYGTNAYGSLHEIDLTAHGDRFVIRNFSTVTPGPHFSIALQITTRNTDGTASSSSFDLRSKYLNEVGSFGPTTDLYLHLSELSGIDPTRATTIALSASRLPAGTEISLSAISVLSAGDFDGDGSVSQNDLTLVLANWGATTSPPTWTAAWDGQIDQSELTQLLNDWGAGGAAPATATTAVPEPATAALLCLPALIALRHRQR